MNNDAEKIREAFAAAGQNQVFRFWGELSGLERRRLIEQAAEIDLEEIEKLVWTHLRAEGKRAENFDGIESAPYIPLPDGPGDAKKWQDARAVGEEALRAGRVAAFTVAGGQGTRLGYNGPKGTFAVTPITRKSLFQVFAEKIIAAGRRHGRAIPWFIMTSHANHDETERFFRMNGFFGLDERDVMFFRQGRMPAVDMDGRILLESKSSIAMSPDGHGGSLRALCRGGAASRMEEAGVDVISYFQVDNPLARLIDPHFIGFHLLAMSEMSCKMVSKSYPEEKVGVFCARDGRMMVVEYSDLPEKLAKQRDKNGQLRLRAGSISIQILALSLVRRLGEGGAEALPFHRANKKIPTIDDIGNPVRPDNPNGVKFEMFVFDALPFARNPVIVETSREEEFSPVKNANGLDSAASCARDQLRQAARWLDAAGATIETNKDGLPPFPIEISPLFASDKQSFVDAWQSLREKPELRDGVVIGG